MHIVAQAEAGPVIIYARRDLKPQSLNLLPFSGLWAEGSTARPSNAVPFTVTVKPEGEPDEELQYWVKAKEVPKKLVAGAEEAVIIVPFFALALQPVKDSSQPASSQVKDSSQPASSQVKEAASVEVTEPVSGEPDWSKVPMAELAYEAVTYEVSPPVTKGGPRARPRITIKVLRLTNTTPVAKGSRLFVTKRVPNNLHIGSAP